MELWGEVIPLDTSVEDLVEEFFEVEGNAASSPLPNDSTPPSHHTRVVSASIPYKRATITAHLIDHDVMFIRTRMIDVVAKIETEQLQTASGSSVRIWVRKYSTRSLLLKEEISDINIVTRYLEVVYKSFFGITQPITFSCDPLSTYTPGEVQAYWKLIKKQTRDRLK
jgi:hypothetical protein